MNYALLFAGGVGKRMRNTGIPKQFINVDGKPILIHTIFAFEKSKNIDAICVVCLKDWIPYLQECIDKAEIQKVRWIVPGAETGQQSIYNGLKAVFDCSSDAKEDIVLINDGVRPFVSEALIDTCIHKVKLFGSAITVCPVPETVVEILEENGEIISIPDRNRWFLSKAPQAFFLNEIIEAHLCAMREERFDCTNSAELMKRYGHSLYTVVDSPNNIKITTPIDVRLMEVLLEGGYIYD